MIVTTTPSVEGHCITRCHGIAAGAAIFGASAFRDLFAQSSKHDYGLRKGSVRSSNDLYRAVLFAPPLELAMEAQSLVAISLEGSVG